jgi:glutamyl-tRNA synthetase
VQPVLRFKNPIGGAVVWDDKVKGRIEISNDELDDLVIARPDGTPTYNFCVVVDDIDMRITHVIRGDDHVNNTPRQINIFRALGVEPPVYAHLPTVLNEQGEKMSKRNGAKPVTQYRDEGYLADAMVNYLARLGWSHGDDEIFSREQFLQWFNLDHLGKSAAQFDEAKLRWVNAQHMKATEDAVLAQMVAPLLEKRGIAVDARLPAICGLLKDRCDTTVILADWAQRFYGGRGAERRRGEEAHHRRRAARHQHAGEDAGRHPLDPRGHHRGDQGNPAGHGPEDAAAGHAGAGAGDGDGADAVAGCCLVPVGARESFGASAGCLKSCI